MINSYFLLNKEFKSHIHYLSDEYAPILVSFPRTGTHWVMSCLEEYFGKDVLFDSYVNNDVSDVLILHTHDSEARNPSWRTFLSIIRSNVIVLYRTPIDVIFSWLSISNQDINNENIIRETLKYKAYLNKWLRFETFTKTKTIISYDKLVEDFISEFSKVILHLGGIVDLGKIAKTKELVTKNSIRNKYPHMMTKDLNYNISKNNFKLEFGNFITEILDDCMYLFEEI